MDRAGTRLPPGQFVDLPGRGRTWVYDSGPLGDHSASRRPALMLLHGWTSTAAMNWFRCIPPLSEQYRVVALDHRGHGRGIRSRRPFRLEDCADDVAALAQQLSLGPVTAVGYSMGGPIAQLLWKRHPEAVDGLVLCATATTFATRQQFRGPIGLFSYGVALAVSGVPGDLRQRGFSTVVRRRIADSGMAPWAIAEWQRHDPAALLQAGIALGRFDSSPWVGGVAVPTSVVITELDVTVSPRRQHKLAESIPGARTFSVQADHHACVEDARHFVPVLLDACRAAQQAPTATSPSSGP